MRLIDLHCDTLWLLMRNQGTTLKKNTFGVDVEKLKKAGSILQFFACFIYLNGRNDKQAYDEGYEMALAMLQKGREELSACQEDISLIADYGELIRRVAEEKMSAMFTIEEGGILNGSMERLERLYEEGVRLLTLTWNYENCIGYPNSRDASVMQRGLKPFGVEVVERMNELGMVIDVSHLSDGGFWDALKYSKRPIMASHSNARTLCNHPRNLSDEMIKALAENGGIVGLNFYPYFVNEKGIAMAEDLAEHMAYIYQLGGEDVLAIGTDYDGFDEGKLEMADIGEIGKLYHAAKRRGFTERQLEKIWSGNVLRFLKS